MPSLFELNCELYFGSKYL